MPADPKDRMRSPRDQNATVNDLEAYKLNAVYVAAQQAGGPSVVNNVWRLLMWRRMLHDWWNGSPWLGAGVGHEWEYNRILLDTWFHYEPDAGGLNPHNSYLNLLYRCGAIGVALLLVLMAAVLYAAWRALTVAKAGDVLLEGIALCFFYTAVFAFFTVSLEGPSYSLPLWTSLGLLYARARQVITRARLGIGD
jgi:O-antigen ligase